MAAQATKHQPVRVAYLIERDFLDIWYEYKLWFRGDISWLYRKGAKVILRNEGHSITAVVSHVDSEIVSVQDIRRRYGR